MRAFQVFVGIFVCLSGSLTVWGQESTGNPVLSPTFQEGSPKYSAQGYTGVGAIFDSYWYFGNWKIHCSQNEFCYIHLPLKATRNYEGGEVVQPLKWEPDRVIEHSFAFGIKSGTTRTSMSFPFWSFEDRVFSDNLDDYNEKGRPDITTVYIIDGSIIGSRHHGNKIPLHLSIWGDWEADARPLLDSLVSRLYHKSPKELDVRIDIEGQPAVSLVFDVSNFQEAYGQMQKERLARNEIHKAGQATFSSWPMTVEE